MFRAFAMRCRGFGSRTGRRSNRVQKLFCSQCFAPEVLELRQMLSGTPAGSGGSLYPLTAIPPLHSNPSATAKLYLDFDGYVEADKTTPAFDLDDAPTSFSDTELAAINMTWSKVAEDYAPFNIDVTLEEPPELGPGVPESVANGVALRVAIGGDGSWTGGTGTGYCGINAFTNSIANVAYVFSKKLADTTYIGDIASHEAGHGFGLSHQSTYDESGVKTDEVNHGDGTWAPIMGSPVPTTTITTWYNGTSSAGPTTYQDDMAMIARSANGFGYRADDHGNSSATATFMTPIGSTWTDSGIIETNDDVDFVSFTTSASQTGEDTYRIDLNLAEVAPNLHAVLGLYQADGTLLATANPAASVGASITTVLTSDATYFVSVKKTTDYGRVGAYSLNISTPPAGINVTKPEWLVTREGGPASTFTVALDTQPTADVMIPVSSSDEGEATVSTTRLLFTPADWNVPQTVTVTGVEDGVPDGDVHFTIVFVPATSDDPEYATLDAADLDATNLDNSFAGLTYWVDYGSDTINRSSLQGTDVETLVDLKTLFGALMLTMYRGISPSICWPEKCIGQTLVQPAFKEPMQSGWNECRSPVVGHRCE